MGKQKKSKDKKDKKKNKDRERQRQKQRQKKERSRKQKKRSYSSSSSSSSDSSDSSSQSRERTKRKQSKIKKKDKKDVKSESKTMTNPYDFQKTVSKVVPGFPVGLPSPGFSVPMMHPTPPPPMAITTPAVTKPKTKEINIFKLLPKLPYGPVLFAKTLYSTEFIEQKFYNKLLTEMMSQIDSKVKQQSSKRAINVISKCSTQIQKVITAEQEKKKIESFSQFGFNKDFLLQQDSDNLEKNRFKKLQMVYDQCLMK